MKNIRVNDLGSQSFIEQLSDAETKTVKGGISGSGQLNWNGLLVNFAASESNPLKLNVNLTA